MKTTFRAVCFAAVCILGTLTSAPAAQASSPTAPSVAVRFSDLDLTDAHDANLMLRRVKRAADLVCGAEIALQYRAGLRSFKACRRSTIAGTVVRLDAPVLSARYAARYGEPAHMHVAIKDRVVRRPIG